MGYQRDPNRPPPVKLYDAEWTTLIMRALLTIGRGDAEAAVERALGKERARALIDDKVDPRLTKRDNHRLVQEFFPLIPGDTDEAKEAWLIQLAMDAFPDTERFREIVDYARHRVGEFQDAGGTLDKYPEPETTITGEQGGFVWKPEGEHTGKLVVLIPVEFTGKTNRVMTLTDGAGHVERSNRAHNTDPQPNGNREHFRYDRAGQNYAGPVTLEIVADGITWVWTITDPARRYDHLKPVRLR